MALAQFLTNSDCKIRPLMRAVYDPYRIELVGYEIEAGDLRHYRQAMKRLLDEYPQAADNDILKKKILYLMANTKRRREHVIAEQLMVSGMIYISRQFPIKTVGEVIMNWYKRGGDEAIFTPSQAEFYRALKHADQPRWILLNQFEKLIEKNS